ncbi:carboxylesterase 5A-like [Paramacrobiotus metropolitanus]|uniref:carboxylesterase 5A-like n=1 Tax=Paramacrobiotus metropolitanus TaxID=2943436 RepID=UPI002445D643|nr:carboxylesterase 5A-like [Paramacrobiotus metropolitanus]
MYLPYIPVLILGTFLSLTSGQEGHVTLPSGVTFYGDAVPSQSQPGRYGYAYLGIRYGVARRFEPPMENFDFTYLSNQSRPRQGPVCPQASMGPPGLSPSGSGSSGMPSSGMVPPGMSSSGNFSGMPSSGMFPPGMSSSGMFQPGMTTPGTSSGMPSSGMFPQGMSSSGMSSGMLPSGMFPPGMTTPGMTFPGMPSSGTTPSGMVPPMMAPKVMNEDCLYLDVYVPPTGHGPRGERLPPLPVMVYIYGGALQSGDKDSFNSSALADSINAVIVTINYRVNVFGFLSTADGVASGNYGVADCKLALRWIRANILRFGGDPNAITIFGESAGATMVSALLLDPNVRREVRGAVMMSGSVMVDTLYIRDPRSEAFAFGNAVGCSSSTTAQLVACLKQLPAEQITQAASVASQGRITQKYGLVVDHDHIRDLPVRALQRETRDPSNAVSILTGYLREDVSFLLQLTFPNLFDQNQPLTLETVCDLIARQFLLTSTGSGQVCSQPNYALAQRVMQRFNMTISDTRQQLLWKLFQLGSESQFGYPAAKEAAFYTQRGHPPGGWQPSSQVFRITYDAGTGLGAFHTLDIQHIFGNPSPFGVQLNPAMTNSMRQMLRQIAYNGRMEGADFSQGGRYMELNQAAQWQLGTHNMVEMIRFWDEVANTPCLATNTSQLTRSSAA